MCAYSWRDTVYVLLPDVCSAAELPATLSALRSQQHRWMRGVAQNSRTFLRRAWRHPMTLRRRLHLVGQLLETAAFMAWGAQVLLAPAIAWGFATGHVGWPVAANLPLAATFLLLLPVYSQALSHDAAGGRRPCAARCAGTRSSW